LLEWGRSRQIPSRLRRVHQVSTPTTPRTRFQVTGFRSQVAGPRPRHAPLLQGQSCPERLQSSGAVKLTHAQILWYTLLTVGLPLFLVWRLRTRGLLIRLILIAMLLTFLLNDVGIWLRDW
jgi:hypothetical protein